LSSFITQFKIFYPNVADRNCSMCRHYTPIQVTILRYGEKSRMVDGVCRVRSNIYTSSTSSACQHFRFKNPTCSICGKMVRNYCQWHVYIKDIKELRRFGYDGVEFQFLDKGYAILCLDCWRKGVKLKLLTYGESPSIEETDDVE